MTRTTDNPTPTHDALHRLARASEDVRAARSRYLAEQHDAWERYVAVVDKALIEDLGLEGGAEPDGKDVRP